MTEKHPQNAFIGLTKLLFLKCVVANCVEKFKPLEEALVDKFITRLFGVAVTLDDRQPFELPVHIVGLGISS